MPNRRVSRTGLRCALALIAIPIVFGQTPVPGPALNFVTPITAPAGSSGFVLNLSGSNFVAGSQAFWNTVPLPTSFISAGQLSASVTPNLLLAPGQVSVYVRNPNGTQSLPQTFTIGQSVVIVTTALPAATAGSSYSASLVASSGTPPYNWQADSLPAGLTLSAGGVLSGTPTAQGTFAVNVRVTDAAQASATKTFQLSITAPAFSINQASPLPQGTAGQAYTATFTATGGTAPLAWAMTGALPPGLTLNTTTGVLSGVPGLAGSFDFTLQVRDAASLSATKQFNLRIAAPPLTISTVSPLFEGTVGVAYAQSFSATGGVQPFRWSLQGAVPGLTLDASTGTLQGSPTSAGSYTVSVTVTDNAGGTTSKTFTLTVNPPTPLITTASPLPPASAGVPYTQTFTVIRTSLPVQWTIVTGSMPGLTMNPATGTLAGTPITPGTYTFTVEAKGNDGTTATKAFVLTVNPGRLSIAGGPQTFNARIADSFSLQLAATGGTPPYTWSANGLPDGLSLDANGRLTGSPNVPGTFPFTIRVVDAAQAVFTDLFRIVVDLPPGPAVNFAGVADTANAAEQPTIRLQLDQPYAAAISGQLFLSFSPDTGSGDSTVQFSSGGRQVGFQIPAGGTSAVFDAPDVKVQTGTVAGIITLTPRLQSSGVDVPVPGTPAKSIRVNRAAPVIVSARAIRAASSIDVEIVGYSTTREITQAVFRFASVGTAQLQTSEVTIPVDAVFRNWFDDPGSVRFGSQFKFVQRFNIQGDVNAVTPQSVTFTNRTGTATAQVLP